MRRYTIRFLTLLLALMLALPAVAEDTDSAAETETEKAPVLGYVYVEYAGYYQWFALPTADEEERDETIRLYDEAGNEYYNVLHLTHDGVYVSEANCENQDCVGEGIVTLENKDERILGAWIICLPHQVSIELFSTQELIELMSSSQESQ